MFLISLWLQYLTIFYLQYTQYVGSNLNAHLFELQALLSMCTRTGPKFHVIVDGSTSRSRFLLHTDRSGT